MIVHWAKLGEAVDAVRTGRITAASCVGLLLTALVQP